MTRPLIGISGSDPGLDGAERAGVNAAYVHSIAKAGGIPDSADASDRPGRGRPGAGSPRWPRAHRWTRRRSPMVRRPAISCPGAGGSHRDEFELALFHAARVATCRSWASAGDFSWSTWRWAGPSTRTCPRSSPGEIHHDPRRGPRCPDPLRSDRGRKPAADVRSTRPSW